jgi:transposase
MKKKTPRRRIDVDVEELDRVIDGAQQAPPSEADCQKLRTALHALVESLERRRSTEKTGAVLGEQKSSAPDEQTQSDAGKSKPAGHGRNGADALSGAGKVKIAHGNRHPAIAARIAHAAMFMNGRSRRSWCGSWVRRRWLRQSANWSVCAATPAGRYSRRRNRKGWVRKNDETAAAMIAQLKYGSGVPFNRLEQLEGLPGIPLPAATRWEVVGEAPEVIRPTLDELTRQAAQGEVVDNEVMHNDDTSMRVLKLARASSDERTGVFTTGIVSKASGREVALRTAVV